MFSVALVEPEIPQNTGNIARLCAATRTPLYVVGVTGFRLDDRAVRRAGLDYWDEVSISRHRDLTQLHNSLPHARLLYFSTKGERSFWDYKFEPDDCFVFGSFMRLVSRSLVRPLRTVMIVSFTHADPS